jgi:hypothetical protein
VPQVAEVGEELQAVVLRRVDEEGQAPARLAYPEDQEESAAAAQPLLESPGRPAGH